MNKLLIILALLIPSHAISQEVIIQGEAIFKTNCVPCHGKTGKGDGVAAAAFNPPPSNLIESHSTITEVLEIIENGKGSMPAFDHHLSPGDVALVSIYAHRLQAMHNE